MSGFNEDASCPTQVQTTVHFTLSEFCCVFLSVHFSTDPDEQLQHSSTDLGSVVSNDNRNGLIPQDVIGFQAIVPFFKDTVFMKNNRV